LMQDVIASRLPGRYRAAVEEVVVRILARAASDLPDWWTPWHCWAPLGPHLLHAVARLGPNDPNGLRRQAIRFCIELIYTGAQYQAGRLVADRLYATYSSVLGHDHPDTLRSATLLAECLVHTDDDEQARTLAADTYARQCAILGVEDPDTLETASTLCQMLYYAGEQQAALKMARDTRRRRCLTLGPDHVDTLWSADT